MFHVKLDPRSTLETLTDQQRRQLREYESLLVRAAIPQGYVSAGDKDRIWERHIMDSLRVLSCLPRQAAVVVDVGSGAGLPGIPMAIGRADCSVVLLEPKARRVAFLELAAQQLGLANVRVVHGRAEESGILADVAVARALAQPRAAWEICHPLLVPQGFVLYFSGRSWRTGGSASLGEVSVVAEICVDRLFPWQGPIVKMMRQLTPRA